MMKTHSFLLTAGISLAMAFTFSCSSGDDDGGGGNPSSSNCSADFRTVTIGTQTWMAENLNCNVEGSKCYDNDPANCAIYGRLYDWSTARTVCPSDWHLPSDAEWDKLFHYVDGTSGTSSPYASQTAGRYLKAMSGWYDNGNGTDQYDFSALPGGNGFSDDDEFYEVGMFGAWWSANQSDSEEALIRGIEYDHDAAIPGYADKSMLFSVRCMKN